MDIFVAGKGKITLSDSKDFLAEGGQAKIYAKNGAVFKIYSSAGDMIPAAKIKELKVLDNPKIIRPQDIILDSRNREIGYTMRHIENAYALCELFPQAFWDRKKLKIDTAMKLVADLQESVHGVHAHNIFIVDLNEMNFLVENGFKEIYLIDVDNYETPNFKCTAIMPNIRDWHAKKFGKESDWFSFGVLTFNLLVGIHPFKGRHPDYKWPIDEATLTKRMVENASVLDSSVQLPGACRPFASIPKNYLNWYQSLFVDGKRDAPPSTMSPIVAVKFKVQRVQGTDNFDIKELIELPEQIIGHYFFGGTEITTTVNSLYSSARRLATINPDSEICITPKTRLVLSAEIVHGKLKLYNVSSGSILQCDIAAEDIMSYDGRLYIKKSGKVMQVEFTESGITPLPYTTLVAQCHEKASKMYDGVIIQPLMGQYYASIFPQSGQSVDIHLNFVEGQIIAAKYDNKVLMIVSNKGGKYNRYTLRLASDFSHDLKTAKDVPFTGLNFVVLDNGICCHMTENEEIELSRNVKDDPMIKVVPDSHIDMSMRLFKNGTQVIFAKDNSLYSIKLK